MAEERGRRDGLRDKMSGAISYEPLSNIIDGKKTVVDWLYEISGGDTDDEYLNNLFDIYCDAYRETAW